jgi:hypothetical protein
MPLPLLGSLKYLLTLIIISSDIFGDLHCSSSVSCFFVVFSSLCGFSAFLCVVFFSFLVCAKAYKSFLWQATKEGK